MCVDTPGRFHQLPSGRTVACVAPGRFQQLLSGRTVACVALAAALGLFRTDLSDQSPLGDGFGDAAASRVFWEV